MTFGASVLAIALSTLLLLAPARAQPGLPAPGAATQPIIHVNGTGRVERKPDFVDVTLGVQIQHKSAQPAQAAAEATMRRVLEAIKALDLSGQDVQPGMVELQPFYDEHTDYRELRPIIGYRATITLRVRTTDLGAPAQIIDAALTAGATNVEGVEFGIKEAIAAREEAIALASRAAKRKAEALARSLDVRLGRIVRAETSGAGSWWPMRRSANYVAQISGPAAAPGGDGDQGAIVPGQIEIWAEVNVTFAISEGAPEGH
jgi:uncharacterized protein